MTATIPEAFVPAPLAHQLPAYDSPARFKVLRCGRRWGKDRVAFTSAIVGHGPTQPDGDPLFKGVVHTNPRTGLGYWIGWVVRDYPQALGLWEEEFLPRFAHLKPEFQTNKTEMTLRFPNAGGIRMCTDENIDSLRGLGKSLGGIVVNEAAHLPLEYAWKRVINWILVDNEAWAIIMSTTNSGLDGNTEGITPSYFNRICLEIRQGGRSQSWVEFTGTGDENAALSPSAVAEARAELLLGSLEEKEEWYADLVPAGAGLAFPSWNPVVHLIEPFAIPQYWRALLGMDWGIREPAVIELLALGTDKEVVYTREWSWMDTDAYELGYEFMMDLLTMALPTPWPEWLWCDDAMNTRTGVAGRTILMEFQDGLDAAHASLPGAPRLIAIGAPKGPGSREMRFNMTEKLLAWDKKRLQPDNTLPASAQPICHVFRGQCPMLVKDLATLPLHPTKKMDVDVRRGGGHAWDAATYPLIADLPQGVEPVRNVSINRSPGWLPTGQKRSRDQSPEVQREERRIVAQFRREHEDTPNQGRYGPSRPR